MQSSLIPNFKGKRLLKMVLRTVHLIGFAGVFTAILTAGEYDLYWVITIGSGLGLLILEALSNLVWFVQVRGLVMYLKFILFTALFIYPEYGLWYLISIIILSGLIAHAPGALRYYSLFHGKAIYSVNDIKG